MTQWLPNVLLLRADIHRLHAAGYAAVASDDRNTRNVTQARSDSTSLGRTPALYSTEARRLNALSDRHPSV